MAAAGHVPSIPARELACQPSRPVRSDSGKLHCVQTYHRRPVYSIDWLILSKCSNRDTCRIQILLCLRSWRPCDDWCARCAWVWKAKRGGHEKPTPDERRQDSPAAPVIDAPGTALPCRRCHRATGDPVVIDGADPTGALVPKAAQCRCLCAPPGKPPTTQPDRRLVGTARKPGRCSGCPRDIVPGDRIMRTGEMDYVHLECAPASMAGGRRQRSRATALSTAAARRPDHRGRRRPGWPRPGSGPAAPPRSARPSGPGTPTGRGAPARPRPCCGRRC
jgi:hypothetical protein